MRTVYLGSKDSYSNQVLPLLWCSLKTYYEENSAKANQWTWADPRITSDSSKEEILELCRLDPPSVFGFSIYVWNEEFFEDLAKTIKDLYPECLIVYGGPQPNIKYNDNFFQDKPWVDIVVPSDAYGEIVFKEILDNYPIQDYETIPYIYYPDKQGTRCFSKTGIEKRSYKWPQNIYRAQEKHLLPYLENIDVGFLETSRGCPYKCIYCDWGGGTYTKVTKKPYTTVLDEIEWLCQQKVNMIYINDANFGIMEIDIEIAEQIAACSKKYGYPKSVVHENSKNHLDRVVKIKEIFVKHNLSDDYKISIQTSDDEIKDNIERIDVPFEEQVKAVQYLKKNFADLPIKVETITGLPGDNYNKNLTQINSLINNDIPVGRCHTWLLLPESPAFSPEMRDKFKIKTIKKMLWSGNWAIKEQFKNVPGVHSTVASSWINTNVETVIGTYSYSTDEWIDMHLINAFALGNESTNINNHLRKYMKAQHNVEPAELLDVIFKKYVKPNALTEQDNIRQLFAKSYTLMYDWVFGDGIQGGVDYHPDFPMLMSPHTYYGFVALTNADAFYRLIGQDLAKQYNDPIIEDLAIFLRNSIIDSDYDPTVGRTFTTKYNWLEYFETYQLASGSYTYQITDQEVYLDRRIQEINWHQYRDNPLKKHEQYLYQARGIPSQSNYSRTVKLQC